VQHQAHTTTIEEVEEEDQKEYKQEEIADLAARTTRLSNRQCETLFQEITNASPNF
jgi:transcriptional regulator GlxA family with amidase domain